MFGFVPSGLGFRSNGTLIISMRWIIVKSLGSSFNDLLKTIKTIFNNITVSFLGLKDHPHSKNWTLDFAPAFLQRFEPTIHFSDWSAVSPSKSRDFPLPEPTIHFSYWSAVKPRDFRLPEPAIFPHGQRF